MRPSRHAVWPALLATLALVPWSVGPATASPLTELPPAGVQPSADADSAAGAQAVVDPAAAADVGPAAEARRTGRPVELVDERSETADLFVQPDGNHTLTQYAEPVRARKGTGWAPIDTTLAVGSDGLVRPGATVTPLTLSGGGDDTPLVVLGNKKTQVRMSWPAALPRPVLDKNVATYPDVLPGVDLKIRAESDSFAQVLVVKTPEAAKNPALRTLRFPLAGTGVTIATKSDGTTVATDAKGTTVFTAGSPVMWDSPASAAGKQAAASGDGSQDSHHASLPAKLDAGDLVVTPNQALLAGAQTRFPVYIDPSWTGSVGDMWTHVNRLFPDQSYWDYDRGEGAKVGWAWDNSGNMYRSMFQLGTAGIAGSRVISARFTITLDHTPTGSPTQVDLWKLAPISRSQAITWNNTGVHWQQYLANASGNAWTNGGQPDQALGFDGGALKSVVQTAADQRASSITLGLKAPDESGNGGAQWKRFRGETAAIVVTYNNVPRMPTKVNFSRPRPCGTASDPVIANTSQPSFSAVASDPDNDNVYTRLEFHKASDNSLVYSLDSALTGSGAAFGWSPVPAGKLAGEVTYYYTARSDDRIADDGAEFGPASPKCYFRIDSTPPGLPALASTDFPDKVAGIAARTTGVIKLSPAAGDTDVAEYLYGFQPEKVTLRVKAAADGTATLPLSVWPTPVPTKKLWVRAIDRAGNPGPVTPEPWTLIAKANPTPVPAVRGDVNGDGKADITALFDQGNGRTAVWNVTAKTGNAGLNNGVLAWDSGDFGGFALSRTRGVQGDFDKDGRADVALFRDEAGRNEGLYLLKSDGNRYDAQSNVVWRSTDSTWTINTNRAMAGDVTGDGRSDIVVQRNSGNGNWSTQVFPGTSLGTPVQWSANAANSGEWAKSTPLLADVDGDKLADLVDFKDLGGCRTVVDVYRSTGTAFAPATQLYDSGAGGYCAEKSHPVVGDVDGDGLDDVVAIYENGTTDTSLAIFRSTGTALTKSEGWRDQTKFEPAKTSLQVGDYDKDGKADAALITSLPDGGKDVYTLTSTGAAFVPPALQWHEPEVGVGNGPKFDLELRTYELVAKHSNKCMDVSGQSAEDLAPLQNWDCYGPLSQRFRLVPVAGTDQYEVQVGHANGQPSDKARCLDMYWGSTADNTQVVQHECHGGANQQVLLEYVEGSSYDTVLQLRFAHSGKCAGIAGSSTANGAKLVQMPCSTAASAANQKWVLRAAYNSPQLGGRYKITSRASTYVLDMQDCRPSLGMRTWDWLGDSSPCQKWRLEPLGDDVYRVTDPSTGTSLQTEGCSRALTAKLVAIETDASECQFWRIEPAYDGSYSILRLDTGRALEVRDCVSTKGPVQIWTYWYGSCQRWSLEKVAS
ncbi:RICIN domain-containing protein [Kribbella sp. NBC_00382]|uniref:RICIN domain-containing protein n=1 Tax=Kribbella sp. NBC_00382 TaxID=2975967 RepID=UPI002E211C0F